MVEATDPTLLVGTGMAGGVMSAEAFERHDDERHAAAQSHLAPARDALGLADVETGRADRAARPGGPCDLAARLPASVVVMGTRGRGGLAAPCRVGPRPRRAQRPLPGASRQEPTDTAGPVAAALTRSVRRPASVFG